MKATLSAVLSIVLWSTLAYLGTQLVDLPPFFVLAVAFLLSGTISLFRREAWQLPPPTLLVGVGGIFGYHFLYFRAFALAPAVEVNLINYLWPLLIVAFTPLLLKGYHLKPRHIIAALMGLLGAAWVVSNGSLELRVDYLPGYLLALGAAVTWAVYSLLTKRLPPFKTSSVAAFTAISGVLSVVFFQLDGGDWGLVTRLQPITWVQLVVIGIGPMGAAFFLWDYAMKHGDPRVIGALAYLTPLLSTGVLIIAGGRKLSSAAVIALVLIVGGAIIGTRSSPEPL
jgi:drug/metabolite transporter (DMT)-like permease